MDLTPDQYEKVLAELYSKDFAPRRSPDRVAKCSVRKRMVKRKDRPSLEDRILPVCVGLPASLVKEACAQPAEDGIRFKLEAFIEKAVRNELERIKNQTT